jgi:hypothetical protein
VCGIGVSSNPTCEIPPVQYACSAGGERSARSRLSLAHRELPDRLWTGSHISRPTTSDGGIFPYVAPGPLIVSPLSDRSVLRRRKFVNNNTLLVIKTLCCQLSLPTAFAGFSRRYYAWYFDVVKKGRSIHTQPRPTARRDCFIVGSKSNRRRHEWRLIETGVNSA